VGRRATSSTEHHEGVGGALDERFEIRGKLGSGGLGVVYRAFDKVRGTEVALKTLRQVTGRDLYRFKREFRSFADIVHPNLVALHELHTVGDEWFLTMELVDGISFIEWIRPHEPLDTDGSRPGSLVTPNSGSATRRHDEDLDEPTAPTTVGMSYRPKPLSASRQRVIDAPLRVERLDSALYQLVDTVHALHLAGKLHRDLKPSNVLVDATGRVVVLDFGLVSEIDAAQSERTHETSAVGTPAYMSPEQAADRPLSPATDWYSVGVMLYEALTGRRPIDVTGPRGAPGAARLPPPPRSFNPRLPARLDKLCMDLLDPEPTRRADGDAVMRALGVEPSPASLELVRSQAAAPFVGRSAELAQLRAALAETRTHGCVAMFVRGASGMGKSALLRTFLDEAAAQPGTVVLKGRCYERESVPFKTLDTLVDSLAGHLMGLTAAELEALLPRDISALARLFPVLRRVPAVAEPALRSFQPPDPLELRRRAFGALRVLLGRLAAEHPVVLTIDDVQWGDADSGTFFADLLHHPDAPALLLVVCHRSEDEDSSPLLAALHRARAALGNGEHSVPTRQVTLAPLDDAEARRLVEAVRSDAGAWIGTVVRESAGSPLFLCELARLGHGERGTGDDGTSLSIDHVVRARVDKLSAEARALVSVVAVAARPLRSDLALAAAGLRGEGQVVATLCAERLLRARHPDDGPAELETYHDRIRAALVARLGEDERRRLHTSLALALESSAEPDHERLVVHWTEAGDLERAAQHAALAAVRAEERVAFHRAAELYQLAIAHGRVDELERRRMRTRLGHALAHAGRLDDSAAAFAVAAEGAPPDEKLELERLELEQKLRAGHLAAGLVKTRQVLAAVGYHLPRTQIGAILSLLGQRFLVGLRGLDFKPRTRAQLPQGALQRIDVLWSVSSGLSFVNPIYGKVLQMRHLRDALGCGEIDHVGLAFCLELGYLGLSGGKKRKQLEALRERALELGRKTTDPNLLPIAMASSGLASFLCGQWREAWDRLRDAERRMRDECTRVRWELDLTEFFLTGAGWYLGETRELARLVPAYLREADERGDVYAKRGLRGWRSNAIWMALGRPDEARAHVEAIAQPRDGHSTQLTHYYELLAHTQIDLYEGHADIAHARVEALWRDLKMLLRIQSVCIEGWHLRARAALAHAATLPATERKPLLALALKAARRIDAESMPWGAPLADLVRAAVAHLSGDRARAVAGLRAAVVGFTAADMGLYAAVARLRLATLILGDEGRTIQSQADTFFKAQLIADPTSMSRMLAPGF
jgi:serine/threonine protein kinase